jgi:hypothetical protein
VEETYDAEIVFYGRPEPTEQVRHAAQPGA